MFMKSISLQDRDTLLRTIIKKKRNSSFILKKQVILWSTTKNHQMKDYFLHIAIDKNNLNCEEGIYPPHKCKHI